MSIDKLRQKYLQYISWIDLYLKTTSSKLNDQSLNVHIEYTILRLLNLVYKYKLKNANTSAANNKAIDAFDIDNKLCFQITSRTDFKKIYSTLQKYYENNLHLEHGEIYFFFLREKKSLTELHLEKISKLTSNKLKFDNTHLIDFYDILNVISEDYDLLEKVILILEREIPFQQSVFAKEKKSLAISIAYEPNEYEYELIIKISELFLNANFSLFSSRKELHRLVDSNKAYLISSKAEMPKIDICILFIKNHFDKDHLSNCFILSKCLEGQTIIQNISFEKIQSDYNNIIATNCYQLITAKSLHHKTNKLILKFTENYNKGSFLNREGIEELKEIYSDFEHKKLNNKASDKYFTYHSFTDYDNQRKFLVVRKNIPSFEKVRDEFFNQFPNEKNFILLVHKDSRHRTDRRLAIAKSLFNAKYCDYVSNKIGKSVKRRFKQHSLLKNKIFIEPILTDKNMPEKGNAGIGEILDWFNTENSPILFLIGQGGIGKTTVCQFLHDELIKENQIVLYINANDLVSDLNNNIFSIGNESYDIYNFYLKWFPKTETHSTLLSRNSFYSNLSNGNIKVIFDGLDEIISSKPNFSLSSFVNFIENLVEVSHLSKIIISLRDYQFKQLLRDPVFNAEQKSQYEIYEVELFSDEMANEYFLRKFKHVPKVLKECKDVLDYMLGKEKKKYKYPPYLLFLLSKIITDDSEQLRDEEINKIINQKNTLDKILIEYLQREYGKKSFINIGIEIKDQLKIMLDLAFFTKDTFNAKRADRIIKKIKKDYYSTEFFNRLTDHPYFVYDEQREDYDFQFDFLRDHLRSIKINNLLENGSPTSDYEIEFIAEFLRPQTVLFKLLLDRLRGKSNSHIIKYLKELVKIRLLGNYTLDIEDAISNLFQLCLERYGKNKSPDQYTSMLKLIFEIEKNSNIIDGLVFKDCPHGHGITFNFLGLMITNSHISNYSRFFECNFNEDTLFCNSCFLNQISDPEISKDYFSANMINFEDNIHGDKSHIDYLLKKDASFSELNSIAVTSMKKLLSSLIKIQSCSKTHLLKAFIINKKLNIEIFNISLSVLSSNEIIQRSERNYRIHYNEVENCSLFIENTFISKKLGKALNELRKELRTIGIK